MKIALDEGARMPTRAHKKDAGLDLYSRETRTVPARGQVTFDTGVHIAIPENYVGMIKSKSGLNRNHKLQSEGVVDAGYTGSVCVILYNHSDKDYTVNKNDKISQLVVMPCLIEDVELVETLETTDRGAAGFGSSGK